MKRIWTYKQIIVPATSALIFRGFLLPIFAMTNITSTLDTYFTPETMSLHFLQGETIMAKQGKPGGRELVDTEKKISKAQLQSLIKKLYEEVANNDNAFIEIERKYSKVLQI